MESCYDIYEAEQLSFMKDVDPESYSNGSISEEEFIDLLAIALS